MMATSAPDWASKRVHAARNWLLDSPAVRDSRRSRSLSSTARCKSASCVAFSRNTRKALETRCPCACTGDTLLLQARCSNPFSSCCTCPTHLNECAYICCIGIYRDAEEAHLQIHLPSPGPDLVFSTFECWWRRACRPWIQSTDWHVSQFSIAHRWQALRTRWHAQQSLVPVLSLREFTRKEGLKQMRTMAGLPYQSIHKSSGLRHGMQSTLHLTQHRQMAWLYQSGLLRWMGTWDLCRQPALSTCSIP